MAGRRPQKPSATVFMQMPKADVTATDRSLEAVKGAILDLQRRTAGVGATGATGAAGPAGPAPSGTGFVRVTAGVLATPAELSGDVSTSGFTATIGNDKVTFAKMQNISTDRLLGRDTAGTGDPEEITVSGGLEWTGSGGIQRSALTGDVTASAGSGATTIPNDTVTYAKMQNVSATSRFIGRITAGSGDPEELTGTQATTLIDLFSTSGTTKGAVPGSNGATTYFLRGDQTWAAAVSPSSLVVGFFGDGSDGDAVMDGTNDYSSLGISKGTDPVAARGAFLNYYAMTRDVYFNNLTVNSGQNLFTGGCRVFVKGTFTLNGTAGHWGNDGGAAGATTGGAQPPGRGSVTVGGSGQGAPGNVPTSAASNGGNSANCPYGFSTTPGGTGHGGNGGQNATPTVGGTAGTTPLLTAPAGSFGDVWLASNGRGFTAVGWVIVGGGSGGAAGRPAAAPGNGGSGAGGTGGGVAVFRVREFAGSGSITCFGGYGGAGFNQGGGGGGGGGGVAVVIYGTGSAPTIDVGGGTGGAAGGAANTTAGQNGGAGLSYAYCIGA